MNRPVSTIQSSSVESLMESLTDDDCIVETDMLTRPLCLGLVLGISCLATYLAAPTTQLSLRETLQLLDNIQREKELEDEVRINLAGYEDEDTDTDRQDDKDRESDSAPIDKDIMLIKKANYMSLCHFKLCNMGKRSSWRNRINKNHH